jgi:hypothetical protein
MSELIPFVLVVFRNSDSLWQHWEARHANDVRPALLKTHRVLGSAQLTGQVSHKEGSQECCRQGKAVLLQDVREASERVHRRIKANDAWKASDSCGPYVVESITAHCNTIGIVHTCNPPPTGQLHRTTWSLDANVYRYVADDLDASIAAVSALGQHLPQAIVHASVGRSSISSLARAPSRQRNCGADQQRCRAHVAGLRVGRSCCPPRAHLVGRTLPVDPAKHQPSNVQQNSQGPRSVTLRRSV